MIFLVRRAVIVLLAAAAPVCAQSPPGWLRYAIPPDPPRYHDLPHAVVLLGGAPEERSAAGELDRGLGHMVAGTDLLLNHFDPRLDAVVLGTTDALRRARIPGWIEKPLPEEGFRMVHLRRGPRQWWVLQGGSPRAELWAAFRFAAMVAEDRQLPAELADAPQMALRAIDWDAREFPPPTAESAKQVTEVARLLASVGLNAVLYTGDAADGAGLARMVAPYGLRVWLRQSGGAMLRLEDLTAPGLAGIILAVPAQADRQQFERIAMQANQLARALRRSGRGVMLDNALGAPLQDAAAGERLSPEQRAALLRNGLEPNVMLEGPAVSPLLPLAGLGSANFGLVKGAVQAASFQVLPADATALVYPAATWQSAWKTPETGLHGDLALLGTLQAGSDTGMRGGVIGRFPETASADLLRQPLLQANLYAFGRMAWNPSADPAAIAGEWARQSFGDDARVYRAVADLLLRSAEAFEDNNSPFGLDTLAGPSGGPDPARAADLHGLGASLASVDGVGVDRTMRGTGETGRYPTAFQPMLQGNAPDAWLLAMQRVEPGRKLSDGKTVVQAFYDAHFSGAAQTANAVDTWEETSGLVDEERYALVHGFLAHAARKAEIWRESTTEWMQRMTGRGDALGFVGNHAGRVEAESMERSGYTAVKTAKPEDASAGGLLTCGAAVCTASTRFSGMANVYRVETGFFDEQAGSSRFELRVNDTVRAQWTSDVTGLRDASGVARAANAERFVANGIRLQPGDTIAVRAVTADGACAPLDFVEITRDPRWN